MEKRRKGTRCAVCTYCGACFRDESATNGSADAANVDAGTGAKGWSGERCEVCKGCGKCLREWGLFGADAESGATSWADGFKGMDDGARGDAPAVPAPPGSSAASKAERPPATDASTSATVGAVAAKPASENAHTTSGETDAPIPKRSSSPFATLKASGDDADASTGATPGVASACKEFGMDDSLAFAASLGIKPPGQA